MPEPCEFSSLDCCLKRFLWTYPVTGLVPHVGDAQKFPQAHCLKSMDLLHRVSKHSPCLAAVEEDGNDLYDLFTKLMVLL